MAEDSLKVQGFSDQVVERVLNPIRQSSKGCYDARWSCFIKYCEERKLDAIAIAIPQLVEYFQYIFIDKGFQPATINGYRSAINLRLSHRLGDLGSNPVLSKLLRSFERDRPRSAQRVQPWYLSLILLALTQAPFEPINSITLKFLSWKTAFLVALASGRRCCEIHAIHRKKVFHSEVGVQLPVRLITFCVKIKPMMLVVSCSNPSLFRLWLVL